MDIEMPEMDGITALKQIMRDMPCPVIMISSADKRQADITMKALELGAIDFIPKTSGSLSLDIEKVAKTIIETIKIASKVKVKASAPVHNIMDHQLKGIKGDRLVLIGSSTGGPKALPEVLSRLPGDIPAAILVVQHMPEGFTKSFAERLNWSTSLDVKEAEEGDELKRGHVLIAPGNRHMEVVGNHVHLNDDPKIHFVRPAVDVMMKTAAPIYGKKIVGVVLTGMGYDGAEGMKTDQGVRGQDHRAGRGIMRRLWHAQGSGRRPRSGHGRPAGRDRGPYHDRIEGLGVSLMVDKSKYLDVFIEEARENLQGVNNVLLELEEKGFSEESMKVAYRVVHTIKGTAAVIGIEPISELAHVMEDLFGILVEQKKTPEKKLLNLLFRGADTIEKMIVQLEKDGTTDIKVDGLIAEMKKFEDLSAKSAEAEQENGSESQGSNLPSWTPSRRNRSTTPSGPGNWSSRSSSPTRRSSSSRRAGPSSSSGACRRWAPSSPRAPRPPRSRKTMTG